MNERLTGDYSEILATKSQELAELTKAFNCRDYNKAEEMAEKLKEDFLQLSCMAYTHRVRR